jgi:HEAT repeat protein
MLWWTLRQLKSKNDLTRAQAARKLGDARCVSAVGDLIELLPDISYVGTFDSDVGGIAAHALMQIGGSCVDDLIRTLEHASSRASVRAAEVLAVIGDPRTVDPLIALIKPTSDSNVVAAAIKALGEIGDARAIGPLSNLLIEGGSFEGLSGRTMAVQALGSGKFQDKSVAKLLLDVLIQNYSDTTGFLHESAVQGLGRIKDPSCVQPLLEELIKEERFRIWETGTDVLAMFGDDALEPLLHVLNEEDQTGRYRRYVAAKALRKLRHPGAFEALLKALGDRDPEVGGEGARGLGDLKDPRALEPLIAALKAPEFKLREAAAWALGELGERKALEALTVILGDGNERKEIREAAAASIKKLGGGLFFIH